MHRSRSVYRIFLTTWRIFGNTCALYSLADAEKTNSATSDCRSMNLSVYTIDDRPQPSARLFLPGQALNQDDHYHQDGEHRPQQHPSACPSTHPSVSMVHHKYSPLVALRPANHWAIQNVSGGSQRGHQIVVSQLSRSARTSESRHTFTTCGSKCVPANDRRCSRTLSKDQEVW